MKRILLFLSICLLTINGFAQKKGDFDENDIKQFYRTIQGDYKAQLDDSTQITIHFSPIWEHENEQFRWMYVEAVNDVTKEIVTQKVLEIVPITSITFNVAVYNLKSPKDFVGKWSNRSFFDGYNQHVLKGKKNFVFMKTKDFEYQTGWNRPKLLECFPKGDKVHFKFVQEDERFYIKRVPKRSSNIIGITFFKELTD